MVDSALVRLIHHTGAGAAPLVGSSNQVTVSRKDLGVALDEFNRNRQQLMAIKEQVRQVERGGAWNVARDRSGARGRGDWGLGQGDQHGGRGGGGNHGDAFME